MEASIQFSLPVNDSTVISSDFIFNNSQQSAGRTGDTFDTGHTPNDEYITITFIGKSNVSSVKYTKNTLTGMNGTLVETQTVIPTLEP